MDYFGSPREGEDEEVKPDYSLLYPEDDYKENTDTDSDARSIIITEVVPAVEVERRRRRFRGPLVELN